MRIHLLLILLFISTLSVFGQEPIRTMVSNRLVDIVPTEGEEVADFNVVEVKIEGKILRKFSTKSSGLTQIIGTFRGVSEDYVLYRVGMGNGVCAGGTLYVIKFESDISTDELKNISVSPELTTCLGEFPIFSISYNKENNMMLTIANHTLDLEYFNKWLERKPVVRRK